MLVLLACSVVLLQQCALIGVTVLLSCAVVLRVVLLLSLFVLFSYKITRIYQEFNEMLINHNHLYEIVQNVLKFVPVT